MEMEMEVGMTTNTKVPSKEVNNVQKKSKKSKELVKNEEMDFGENPYVSVLSKKLRSIKKKMEKIKALETSLAEGKDLNKEQQDVVLNKSNLERQFSDLDLIRKQVIDVAAAELKKKKEDEKLKHEEEKLKEQEKLKKEQENAKKQKEKKIVDPVHHLVSDEIIKTDEIREDAQLTKIVKDKETSANHQDDYSHVERILRLLHAVTMQQTLGRPVPSPLDFFVKVLLGNTRPPAELSFNENLAESVSEAKKFLSQSTTEVAHDMSYKQLEETVLELVSEKPQVVEEEVEAPSTPQFNFFTESKIYPDSVTLETPLLITSVQTVETTCTIHEQPTNNANNNSTHSTNSTQSTNPINPLNPIHLINPNNSTNSTNSTNPTNNVEGFNENNNNNNNSDERPQNNNKSYRRHHRGNNKPEGTSGTFHKSRRPRVPKNNNDGTVPPSQVQQQQQQQQPSTASVNKDRRTRSDRGRRRGGHQEVQGNRSSAAVVSVNN